MKHIQKWNKLDALQFAKTLQMLQHSHLQTLSLQALSDGNTNSSNHAVTGASTKYKYNNKVRLCSLSRHVHIMAKLECQRPISAALGKSSLANIRASSYTTISSWHRPHIQLLLRVNRTRIKAYMLEKLTTKTVVCQLDKSEHRCCLCLLQSAASVDNQPRITERCYT